MFQCNGKKADTADISTHKEMKATPYIIIPLSDSLELAQLTQAHECDYFVTGTHHPGPLFKKRYKSVFLTFLSSHHSSTHAQQTLCLDPSPFVCWNLFWITPKYVSLSCPKISHAQTGLLTFWMHYSKAFRLQLEIFHHHLYLKAHLLGNSRVEERDHPQSKGFGVSAHLAHAFSSHRLTRALFQTVKSQYSFPKLYSETISYPTSWIAIIHKP